MTLKEKLLEKAYERKNKLKGCKPKDLDNASASYQNEERTHPKKNSGYSNDQTSYNDAIGSIFKRKKINDRYCQIECNIGGDTTMYKH